MDSDQMVNIEKDPETWIDQHGDFLYQYAMSRLGYDTQLAEDMVQDTFLSALKSTAKYQGKSSERTWFVSILKNKIIDHYRRTKGNLFKQTDFQNEEFIESGPQQGWWKEEFAPSDWSNAPDKSLEQKEFKSILQKCMDLLPQNLSAVFSMRELDGFDTDNICKELDISSSNLWVMLHRARTSLRHCLELNWF